MTQNKLIEQINNLSFMQEANMKAAPVNPATQEMHKRTVNRNIDPEEIIVDDDADMPQPETREYEQLIRLTDKFMVLFNEATGAMKYATTLTNTAGNKIKLVDLVRFVEAKKDSMNISELNTIIGFLANIEFKYIRPLMELVESKEGQAELWVGVQ